MTVRCVGAALGSIKGFLLTVLLGLTLHPLWQGMTGTAQGWLAQPVFLPANQPSDQPAHHSTPDQESAVISWDVCGGGRVGGVASIVLLPGALSVRHDCCSRGAGLGGQRGEAGHPLLPARLPGLPSLSGGNCPGSGK